MSVSAAIFTAVNQQLSADLKPLPQTGLEVMGAGGYGYGVTQIRSFLMNVATRLAADTPPLVFSWTQLDPNLCVADTVMTLCGYISSATTGGNGT